RGSFLEYRGQLGTHDNLAGGITRCWLFSVADHVRIHENGVFAVVYPGVALVKSLCRGAGVTRVDRSDYLRLHELITRVWLLRQLPVKRIVGATTSRRTVGIAVDPYNKVAGFSRFVFTNEFHGFPVSHHNRRVRLRLKTWL